MDGDISDDSQESVSLLAEAKKQGICSIFCTGENIHFIFCKQIVYLSLSLKLRELIP